MSLTSISKGNQSNDFNAPSTIKIFLRSYIFMVETNSKLKWNECLYLSLDTWMIVKIFYSIFSPFVVTFLVTQLCQQSSSYFRIFSQNFIIFVKRYFIIMTNFCSSKVTFTKISKVLHIGSFQFSFKVNFIRGSVLPWIVAVFKVAWLF